MRFSRFALLALVALFPVFAGATEPAPPNIIYVLADDFGYGDLGCFGQKLIQTPNIDRLAQEGIRFTDHYTGAPLCAPARCVLVTGKHTGHARIRDNAGLEKGQLQDTDTTFAEVLKTKGYATACIGKWGLGAAGTAGDPLKRGFDHFFGYLDQTAAHFYYPAELVRDGKTVKLEENAGGKHAVYSHDLFTEDALRFVEDNKGKPFLVYLAYTIPHAELLVPEDSLKEYAGKWEEKPFPGPHYGAQPQPRAARAAMITRMDRDIGRIVDKLKALGIEKNTLVIFTGDNGPAVAGGADPKFFQSSGPLKGMKYSLDEGGIREPFVAWWPTKIAAGGTSSFVSGFQDMLPTFAELAGAQVPAGLDGVSIVGALTGKPQAKRPAPYLYWEYNGSQAVRFDHWKAIRKSPEGEVSLYDLGADIGETKDLAKANPEIVTQAEAYMKEAHVDDPAWPLKKKGKGGE